MPEQLEELKEGDEISVNEPLRSVAGPEPLPGGAKAGTYLHELLERVDFEDVKRAASLKSGWSALNTCCSPFLTSMALMKPDETMRPHWFGMR